METFSPVFAGRSKASKEYARNISEIKAWAGLPVTTERKVMDSPPTKTNGTSATLSTLWPVTTANATYTAGRLNGSHFNYVKTANIVPNGANSAYVTATNNQRSASTVGRSNFGVLLYHDGQNIEFRINFQVVTPTIYFKVDDEYVSLTGDALASGVKYIKLAFASRAKRKIEMIMTTPGAIVVGVTSGGAFGGVYTDANDTVEYCQARGPKTVIVGDSFSGGTKATDSMSGMSAMFCDYMGWDNVLYDAIGGTGYIADNTGTNYNYPQRVTTNVIAHAPDVVIVTGGYNDYSTGQTQAAIYAAALAYYQTIKAALPNTLLIVFGPFFNADVAKLRSGSGDMLRTKLAIKLAAQAVGATYIDLIEGRLPVDSSAPLSGVLSSNVSAGATTFKSTTFFSNFTTVELGTGAAADRVMIASSTGPTATEYTYTIYAGTIYGAHTAGDSIVQVGNSLWRGTGYVGATTGVGNCDLYVSDDGVHPSDAGHAAIAWKMAAEIKAALGAL